MRAERNNSDEVQSGLVPGAEVSSRRWFNRRQGWLAAVFFALVVALAFPQIVFLGRSLVPTDNMNPLDYRFSEANYGPGFIPATVWGSLGIGHYPNFHDPGGSWWQGEPALHFFRRAIFSGQLPFWDPSAAGGVPAYNNLQCQFLFPPQILLSLLGPTSTGKNIYILLLFWTSGCGTYCLLRRHGLRPVVSAGSGMVFLFSGALQQIGPSIFLGQIVACMPLLLLVTRAFIDLPTWRRTALLAITYAVVSLASFPPMLMAAFGCTVFYFTCALILEKLPQRRTLIVRFASGVALALGMAAIYYGPAFITVAHTEYVTRWYRSAGSDILSFRSIFDLFSPTATGGGLVYSSPIMGGDIGRLYYVGVAALLLAGLAFGRSSGPPRTLLVSSSALAGLVLLKIFGVRPVEWITVLPGFQNIHYHLYFGILVAFLISLLAGLGLERLLRHRPVIQLAAAVCVLGAGVRALWVLARDSGALRPHAAWRWIADYHLLVFILVIAVALVVAAMLHFRWKALSQIAAGLLLALIFVEGVINATYPRQPQWDVFAHPPKYVSAVQQLQRPARLFIAAALNANLASAFGIETLDSLYMFSPPRMYDIHEKYAAPAAAITLREATLLPPDPVLDRAAISHVLVRQQLPVVFVPAVLRSYPVAYEDDYVALFRRDEALPRYFFTTEYLVTDRSSALTLISTAPSRQVVLESAPPFPPTPDGIDDPEPDVISAKLNSLALRIHAPRPGLLYIADAYYPGWSATVNGQPAPILIANYGFRAVTIPAGDVRLTLTYVPVGFVPGAIISLLALGITIALAFRRPQTSASDTFVLAEAAVPLRSDGPSQQTP